MKAMTKLTTSLSKEQIETALAVRREELNAAVRKVGTVGVPPGLLGQLSHDVDVLNTLLRRLLEPSKAPKFGR
jgi:hypothetical protein